MKHSWCYVSLKSCLWHSTKDIGFEWHLWISLLQEKKHLFRKTCSSLKYLSCFCALPICLFVNLFGGHFVFVYLSDFPTELSSLFNLASFFLSFTFFASLASLPEPVIDEAVKSLAEHLYSTLYCVITFNPIPFLFCSLSQKRAFLWGCQCESEERCRSHSIIPFRPLSSFTHGGERSRWR